MGYTADAWVLEKAGTPLINRPVDLGDPADFEAIVEVMACGVCHTDLGFADGGVAPKLGLPIVLGHEVVGKVTATGARAQEWLGATVMIPAVMPCGECAFCKGGRANACPQQKMPGNDIHGGFASHLKVPTHALVKLLDVPRSVDVRALSVVADAVSTAWQAIQRADLQKGDVAFVIGAGGVGGFLAQAAVAVGATVLAMDVDDRRLKGLPAHALLQTINVKDRLPKDVRKEVHGLAKKLNVPSLRWRIFECSGTTPGQQLAYTLLAQAATLMVVGYTAQPTELRLSNVMAFDATIHGSWGCPPERYAQVLNLIYQGKIILDPFVTYVPMKQVNQVLEDMRHHRLDKRAVLIR